MILKTSFMKPTQKQIGVYLQIRKYASFWMNTNDLSNPTHICDLKSIVKEDSVTLGELTKEEAHELENKLVDLFMFVRSLKEEVCETKPKVTKKQIKEDLKKFDEYLKEEEEKYIFSAHVCIERLMSFKEMFGYECFVKNGEFKVEGERFNF